MSKVFPAIQQRPLFLPSGAKGMRAIGWPRGRIFAIWFGTALFLVVAAVAGNLLFRHAPQEYLVLMRFFAGGAIIAVLATEIFPKTYRRDHQTATTKWQESRPR